MFNIILKQLSKLTQYLTRSRKKPKPNPNPKTIHNLYRMKDTLGYPGINRTKIWKHEEVKEVKLPNKDSMDKETNPYTGEKCIRHPYKLRKYINARRRREKN